jgi:integrase
MRFDPRWPWQGTSRYHGTVTRAKRKNRNGAGSPARLRKDGRYEARATLNTTTGRRRVSFYGATAKDTENERLQALADQAKGIIFSDPAARVKKATARGERPMRSLSHAEASRLAAAAAGTRYEAMIIVALRTGIRQGELAALRWEDVDLDGPRPAITVRHSADTRVSSPRITPTKTGKDRRVRIGPRTVEVLRVHRSWQRFERMKAPAWEDPGSSSPTTEARSAAPGPSGGP